MRRLWIIIPIAIAVGAVTVFSLTVVLAQENERGGSNASRQAAKVAEILGLDVAEVDDAINQARRKLRDEAVRGKELSREDIERGLRTKIEAGNITQADADAYLKGLKAREDSRRITVADVEARLKAGVDAGGLTQEQADERLEAWKKDQAEGLKAREDFRKIDIEDVKAQIRAALASGKITQE